MIDIRLTKLIKQFLKASLITSLSLLACLLCMIIAIIQSSWLWFFGGIAILIALIKAASMYYDKAKNKVGNDVNAMKKRMKQYIPKDLYEPQDIQVQELNRLKRSIKNEKIRKQITYVLNNLDQLETYAVSSKKSKDYEKMKEYYIPMLIDILKQYETLQYTKHDEAYFDMLERVIHSLESINQAFDVILQEEQSDQELNMKVNSNALDEMLKMDGYLE